MSDFLVDAVLRGIMGGKGRKKSKKAYRYLTGRKSGTFVNPTTLLTAAGVAWGIYETMQQGQGGSQWGGGASGGGGLNQPATAPASAASATPLPPLPNIDAPAPAPADDEARMIRLAVSAANADGALNEQERAAILAQAGPDAADVVARELDLKRPLAEIVAGVGDAGQRATLYVLAFTILRADEQVNGAERIYLAQLAHLLGLDPATVQRLEKDTGERIDALGDQGQLGG